MITKPILNVHFIGLKTAQQRILTNILSADFSVLKTTKNIDVLFVRDMLEYDLEYKMIFPYQEILIDNLNEIILKILSTYKSNIVVKDVVKENQEFQENQDYLEELQSDIDKWKKTYTLDLKKPHELNTIFDEIIFLNKNSNYESWKNMKASAILYNIFITRFEYDVISPVMLLDLLIFIQNCNKEKFLIIFDDNYFDLSNVNIFDIDVNSVYLCKNQNSVLSGMYFHIKDIQEIMHKVKNLKLTIFNLDEYFQFSPYILNKT